MKKIISILLLAFTLTTTSNAQALLALIFGKYLSTETFQLGMNLSGSASTITGLNNADYRISWAFGAFGEIKLSQDWFLHLNLTIKTPGGAKNVDAIVPIPPEVDTLLSSPSITRSYNYVTLPIYIKYKVHSFKFGLGAQLGYLTSADDTYEAITYAGNDLSVVSDVRGSLNLWDAGLTGIVDYFFVPEKNMKSLRLSLTYYYGLTDILKDNTGDSWNNTYILLTLGIPVGGSDDAK